MYAHTTFIASSNLINSFGLKFLPKDIRVFSPASRKSNSGFYNNIFCKLFVFSVLIQQTLKKTTALVLTAVILKYYKLTERKYSDIYTCFVLNTIKRVFMYLK